MSPVLKGVERGTLVIADISGYTGLLVDTELEHAQDAVRDLIQTVVGKLRPQLRLAKLEGDAAFVYSISERIDGSQLLDTLEAAYFAFRRRLESISLATTCDCNACIRIPGLNLKLIAHHGSFVRQRLYGGSRHYHLVRRYGISAAEADRMLEAQGGLCAICGENAAEHVDHCHETGDVRGILCFNCNGGLGQFRDRVDILLMAVAYLERTRDQQWLSSDSTGASPLPTQRQEAAPSPTSSEQPPPTS